jgi:cyanophycinase-like exopeptidase
VIVTDGKLEVVGDSSVLVVDARGAKCAAKQPGELHSATGMKLHVLVSGDKLDYGPVKDD